MNINTAKKIKDYTSICNVTGKNETIYYEVIMCGTKEGIKPVRGLMCNCSVKMRNNWLNVCEDCNILKELQ